MIFLKLMLDRTGELLKMEKSLEDLPQTLSELVNCYVENALRDQSDLSSAIQNARKAAQVYLGDEFQPISRPESFYLNSGVSREQLEKFVLAGLMVKVGEKGDPFLKFALDPVAEQLNAYRIIVQFRDDCITASEATAILQQWDKLPRDFQSALRRAGASFRKQIEKKAPEFTKKLWASDQAK